MATTESLVMFARENPVLARAECQRRLSASDEVDPELFVALGWAELQLGDLSAAEAAVSRARSVLPDSPPHVVLLQLGYLEGVIRIAQGLSETAEIPLRQLADTPQGASDGQVLMALAIVLAEAGETEQALERYASAKHLAEEAGDPTQLQRVLNNRAILHMEIGQFDAAHADLVRTEELAHELGDEAAMRIVEHNHGALCARRGELPSALDYFSSARERSVHQSTYEIGAAMLDEAQLWLDAGLIPEATSLSHQAASVYQVGGAPVRQLEALVLTTRAAAAAGSWKRAAEDASAALAFAKASGFESARTEPLEALRLHCELMGGDERSVPSMAGSAAVLQNGIGDYPELAIELALAARRKGERELAADYLGSVAASGTARSALVHLHNSVASVAACLVEGRSADAVEVASQGLSDVAANALALGVTEFRGMAARRVRQLTELGVEGALDLGLLGQAVALLEQQRAIELNSEPPLTPDERSLVSKIRRLVAAKSSPITSTAAQVLLRQRLEDLEGQLRVARRSVRSAPARSETETRPLAWSTAPGHSPLVIELFQVSHRVCALLTRSTGEQSQHWLSSADELNLALEHTSVVLGASAFGDVEIGCDGIAARLSALLGPVVRELNAADEAVAIVDQLIGHLPWSLLSTTPVTHSVSRGQFRTTGSEAVEAPKVSIVVGPRLHHVEQEAADISKLFPTAQVLSGEDATLSALRHALHTSDIVHFAAHGHFRHDNPLMSYIELSLGPLTFYDLMDRERLPQRLVFSSCDLGQASPRTAVSLAGLLFRKGCRAFVSACGETNDRGTAELMAELYRELANAPQEPMAHALRAAQSAVSGQPSLARFQAFGPG